MDAPTPSGAARVITPAETVELKPPPLACVAGASSINPLKSDEASTRKSALTAGAVCVVMSTMRKRRRDTGAPVVLMNLRRMARVPNAPLVTAVVPHSRAQAVGSAGLVAVPVQPGSMGVALTVALRWTGLFKLSGPGAPSRAPKPQSNAVNAREDEVGGIVASVLRQIRRQLALNPVLHGRRRGQLREARAFFVESVGFGRPRSFPETPALRRSTGSPNYG